jgi:hypothetical protein
MLKSMTDTSRPAALARRRLSKLTPRLAPLGAVFLMLITAGCSWLPLGQSEAGFATVGFRNETAETVSVVYRSPAGKEAVIVHAIGPGQVGSDDAVAGGDCTIGVLIARNAAGAEVARRSEPLCLGDTWAIVVSR